MLFAKQAQFIWHQLVLWTRTSQMKTFSSPANVHSVRQDGWLRGWRKVFDVLFGDQHFSVHTQDKDTNDDGLQHAPIHVEPKNKGTKLERKLREWGWDRWQLIIQTWHVATHLEAYKMAGHGWHLWKSSTNDASPSPTSVPWSNQVECLAEKKPIAAGPALLWEKRSPTECGTLQNGICIHMWTWPNHTWISGVYPHISLQNSSFISHHILKIWQGFIYRNTGL